MSKRTTLVYTVHNNYLMFRASIELLLKHVPREQYNKILIMDDCSSEKRLVDFLTYLSKESFIDVIKTGEPANLSFYNRSGRGRVPPDKDRNKTKMSKGHGSSLNLAISKMDTEFMFAVDPDILFTEKSKDLIAELEKNIDQDEKIMVVGQLVGNISGPRICSAPFKGNAAMSISDRCGWHSFAATTFCKTAGWKKHKLPLLGNGGWPSEEYSPALFKRGFKTSNHNIFRDKYLIHVGYTSLRLSRESPDKKFPFAQDGKSPWGSWYGYHQIPYDTAKFMRLLEITYKALDFKERKTILI